MFSRAGRPYCEESDSFIKLQTAKARIEAYEPFHSICFEHAGARHRDAKWSRRARNGADTGRSLLLSLELQSSASFPFRSLPPCFLFYFYIIYFLIFQKYIPQFFFCTCALLVAMLSPVHPAEFFYLGSSLSKNHN